MENQFYQEFDWAQLKKSARPTKVDYRTPFQIDRDRIIHTSAFRSLQNKTQVFFSGEYDFYRTRLTHSIEVAQIGRSICTRLLRTSSELDAGFYIDPDLVEAACLSHDIGHPPFGHTGERTLHRLMKPYGGFEGNAQTLRILTHTIFTSGRGMKPTRALVDGVLKYKTLFGEVDDQQNHFLYQEQAEWLDFIVDGEPFPADLPAGEHRNGFRSIECQIMDWADDTAYSVNDLADGIHAGFINIERIEKWAENQELDEDGSKQLEVLIQAIRKDRIEGAMGRKIGEFIAAADLVKSDGFLGKQSNRHGYRLEIDPRVATICALYKKLSRDLVFRSQQLQQLDRKSDFILSRLFEAFAENYMEPSSPDAGHFCLLSQEDERQMASADSEAVRARLVCDTLARMTDGVATRTYKRLFDADFGSIVDLV